jgi:hypothetical protein
MFQAGGGLSFDEHPVLSYCAQVGMGEEFDGDRPLEDGVTAPVNDTHTTLANDFVKAVSFLEKITYHNCILTWINWIFECWLTNMKKLAGQCKMGRRRPFFC